MGSSIYFLVLPTTFWVMSTRFQKGHTVRKRKHALSVRDMRKLCAERNLTVRGDADTLMKRLQMYGQAFVVKEEQEEEPAIRAAPCLSIVRGASPTVNQEQFKEEEGTRGYKRPDAGKRPKTHSGAAGSSTYTKSGGNKQRTWRAKPRRL